MGKTLFDKTQNKVFKDVTPEGFAEVFEKVLSDEKSKLTYGGTVANFYAQNGHDPIFVMDHICFDLDHPIDFEFLEFLILTNKTGVL